MDLLQKPFLLSSLSPTPYDFFFSNLDYHLSKGKGFSLFNADQATFARFTEQCQEAGLFPLTLRLSSLGDTIPKLGKSPGFVVILQDLPFPEFLNRADFIADQVIFPFWFNRLSICFFSFLDRSPYRNLALSGGALHNDDALVIKSLLCEQIFELLERVNYQFCSPDFLNFPKRKSVFTPLEEKLVEALRKSELSYQPQVKIGGSTVDFLVSHEGKMLIVECEGKAYHDTGNDRKRDQALASAGYPVCHFSGADLLANMENCIEVIKKKLDTASLPSYLMDNDLDPSQMAAALSVAGPIRVLAPAGSGKTKTLINRILHLLNQGIPPEKILALAFNKKARDEMQERLERKGIHGIEVRTFHSLGYEIVRDSLGWTFSGSAAKATTRELMRTAVREHTDLPPMRNKDPLDAFLDGLRKAKMDLPNLSTMTVEFGERVYPFEPIFYSYLKAQLERNYLDFDDMIYLALRALLDDRSLRQAYQSHFEFVLVDEFQDLNQAQLLLLQLLALPENNVFAVGDDDQMIYGFRGAQVKHIIEFDQRFPVAASHVLNTNYRSSRMIVRHTGWLIDHNSERIPKNIQPRKGAQEGSFEISGHTSVFEQARYTGQWLLEHKTKHNLKWSDYAVLYRYNAFQFPVALVLDMLHIPHPPLSGQHLFQTRVGRDVYSYLQVILSPAEAKAADFDCILKRPNKYLTNQVIARARDWKSFQRLPHTQGLREWEAEKLSDFLNRLERVAYMAQETGTSPAILMQAVKTELGLLDFYRDQSRLADDLDQASDEDLLEVILALSENFKTVKEFYQFVCKSIDNQEADGPAGSKYLDNIQKDEVYLGTIHRAKGKEFRNVVYFNLSKMAKSGQAGLEEERRVAYVAATRPKDSLLITFSAAKPSIFLREISLNPAYKDIDEEELVRKSTAIRRSILREETKLQQLEGQASQLSMQFSRLAEKLASQKPSFALPLTSRVLDWRMQRVQARIESLHTQIRVRKDSLLTPLLVSLNDLEEETSLRKALPGPAPQE